MQILGIGDHVTCGSALVVDGKVLAAINDERIVREKMVFGVPRESVKMIMKMLRVSPDEIDGIAVATENQHLFNKYVDFRDGWFGLNRGKYKEALFKMAGRFSKYRPYLPFMDNAYYLFRQAAFVQRHAALRRIFREEFGFRCPVFFLDHHFCHAASAYYTSNFEDATVVTLDGGGDSKSGKVYSVSNGQFRELHSISSFDSLGNLYAYITQVCGYKAGRHEGKITGLAAYGEPIYLEQMRRMLAYENGTMVNTGKAFYTSALKELESLLPRDFSHRDLAASVQAHSEDIAVSLVGHWLEKTNYPDVALAGGVVSNVKINQRIHQVPGVRTVWMHPAMSDEGLAVGAALALHHQLSGGQYDPAFVSMDHVYLGPEYSDEEIRKELEIEGVSASYVDSIEAVVARLLAEDAVVARFNGRMEYGPRALGNRSVLYQPTDPSVNYWLNEALNRTEFMPYAPVVMAEFANRCFHDIGGAENAARFMTITFDCTEWMARNCPGVVHVDNTARPQLVSKEDNPSMHRILAEYYKLTGLPVLINTSFNMHEEPIVCSPHDAIRAFNMGRLDYLAIGNWLVKNPLPQPRSMNRDRLDSLLARSGALYNGARDRRDEKVVV